MLEGHLVEVEAVGVGSHSVLAAPVGATSLQVEDTTPYSGEGGQIDLEGTRLDYLGVDESTSTLLMDPIPVEVLEGDPLYVVTGDEVAMEYRALIDLDTAPIGEDSLEAEESEVDSKQVKVLIPYVDRLAYPIGPYEPPLRVQVTDDLTQILDVPWSTPSVDGSLITPGTLPDQQEDPPEVPEVRLTGLPRGLMIQVVNSAPGWSYRYSLATQSAPTEVTTYPDTARPLIYVEQTPAGAPMVAGVAYLVQVEAFNSAGTATTEWLGPVSLVLEDSNTIAELTVGKITSGNLVGAFALLGALQVGAAITLDDTDGLVVRQPGGGRIHFPADGSPATLSSHLDAFSLNVRDRLTIRGVLNEISPGSEVVLAQGVADPLQPPVVTRSWPTVQFDIPEGSETYGLAPWPADGANDWLTVLVAADGSSVVTKLGEDGEATPLLELPDGYRAVGGLTAYVPAATRPRVAVLCQDLGRPDVVNAQPYRWFGLTFERVNGVWNTFAPEWEYPLMPSSPYRPALGSNDGGGGLFIGRSDAEGVTYATQGTWESGPYTNPNFTVSFPGQSPSDLVSVYRGTADWADGANRWVMTYPTLGVKVFQATPPRADQTASYGFPVANSRALTGLVWDYLQDDTFTSLDKQGNLYSYSTLSDPVVREVAFSWYDSDPAGDGLHESALSPTVSFTQERRSWMQVSTPPPHDLGGDNDPDSVRVWIDGNRQPELGLNGDGTPVLEALYEKPTLGDTTKDEDFPGDAEGAVFRSQAEDTNGPLIQLQADGAGRVGPWSWDLDGEPVSSPPIPDTAIHVNLTSQVTPEAGWQPTLVYGVISGGQVTVSFYVLRTGTPITPTSTDVGNTNLFSGVPTQFTPAYDAGWQATIAGSSGALGLFRPGGALLWTAVTSLSAIQTGHYFTGSVTFPSRAIYGGA